MRKLGVIVQTGPYNTGNLTVDNGHHVTAWIPEYNHENAIRIQKDVRGGWKVELSYPRPGFGKPYLLSLTNHDKGDKMRISIVPQRDFIKTSLMECTFKSLKHFTLTGPNITTNKSQYDKTTDGMRLELVSRGTSRISSHPLQIMDVSVRVIPKEDISDIYVDTGAVIRCTTFQASTDGQGDVFINGTVTTGSFDEEKCLSVMIGTGDLHVNVDGVLGQEVTDATPKKNANLTKRLNVDVQNGNLTNFGSMCAKDYLELRSNNLMLCSDSKHDTAQRGFDSFIALQKEMGNLDDVEARPKEASSINDSRMLGAVQNVDSDHFISIINEEIDPAVKIHGRSIQDEFRAVNGKGKSKHVYDKDQHKKEIIRGGLATCEWKHGVIRADSIVCVVRQDIYDCSQLQGNLNFDVGGSVSVVKPWTWISGTVSGLIRGDLVFYDNAMLKSFEELQVLGNVLISKTSTLWVKEGGKLHCGKVCENQNVIVTEGSFVLNVGELKQDRECGIISNGNLLLSLRDGQEQSWFGYVHVDKHLFIQLKEKVCCDATCIASACDVEFFGSNAQLAVNQTLILEDGDLNLKATETSEIPNFALFGELHAKGINGNTASVCTMPGSIADLTCAWNAASETQTVDIITRTLLISIDSVMTCRGPREEENNNDVPVSARVFTEEKMSVDGKLHAFAITLAIQANSLYNSGEIQISPGTKNKTSAPSTLCINCEKNAVNTGTIKSEGYLAVESEILSNQKGLIESSIDTVLDLGELKQDKQGRIVNHRDLQITLHDEQEDGWYGCVHTDRYLFIQVEKKVACDTECMAKECSVKFEGTYAQLGINQTLNVQEGRLILEATCPSISPNLVVKGRLNATEINGITASFSTMPGATVDLTCVCNGEKDAHYINVLTRSLEINADSVMTCSCLQDKENADILPFPTNVLCKESIAVHGKLQVFSTFLHIQAKLLKNSGKIELSPGIQSRNSTLSSLCITCEKSTANSGTIKSEGNLEIKSKILSSQKGLIESSTDLLLNLGELNQEQEGRIASHRDLYIACKRNTVNSGTITCDRKMEIKSELLSNEKGAIESSVDILLNLGELNQDKEGRIVSHRDLHIGCERNAVNSGTITCEGGLKMRSETLSNEGGVIESSVDLLLSLGELNQKKEGRIVSHRDLYIACKRNTANSGTIECEGDLKMRSENLSNEKGVIKSSRDLFIDVFSTGETTLSGQIYVDKYLCVRSQSQSELSFSAVGGKCETSETFVLPDKFQIACEKSNLSIGSAIVISTRDNIEPECLFRLSRRLKWHQESHLGKVFVEITRSEDTNSASTFIVADSFYANLLSVSVNDSVTTKENLVFEGPSKLMAVKVLEIDKSIGEATFDTELECVNLQANSIRVPGRIRCVQSAGEENPSTIIVDETFTLSGSLECLGCVEINVEKEFGQENNEASTIDVLQTLRIITSESGLVSLEGLTTGKRNSSLEIEAKDIKVSGSIMNVPDLKLTAEKDLHLTKEGRIFSCEAVEMKGEWMTMAGLIKEFQTLQIQPWALLNSGKIESDLKDSNVLLSSYLALVNSGSCKGQVTSLEAPFLLSLPGKDISDVNDVTDCELVGRDRILLESITCFLGGSILQSNKLVGNKTVLLFKFLSYVSCTPDSKSLQAWSKAAESLRQIQSDYAEKGREISNSLKDLKKECKESAEIGLRIDQMYRMVNMFVADILKDGIESFDVPKLVFIITSESQRYTTINIWKEKLLAIPHEARQLRQWMKKKGSKGVQSIMKRLGFSESERKSNLTEGIIESGALCFSEGVTFTDSAYQAMFDEVFCDEGVLSACDVVVSSKEISMSKREKKAVAMMMFADEVCQAGDITSDSFIMKSEGKAKLVGKVVSDKAAIHGEAGVDLDYRDKSTGKQTADHRFNELALKTNKMNQVNDLLKGQGVYEDLKIADQLDLAVTDQDIVLSRCNIEKQYKLKLQAKSVNIDNSRVHYDKGVTMTSRRSINVSDSSISSRASTILRSTEGNISMDSSHVEASNIAAVQSDQGSISMKAGSISGDQGAFLKAKDDITIDPIESQHSSSSSDKGFFSSSKESSSYSTVSKACISSKSGNVGIVSEEGSVKATATEINAAKNIGISAKKDVVIQDKVTIREEVHEKRNWFRKKRTIKRTEEHHCSTLKAGGSLSITSQGADVFVLGTKSQVGGDMMLHAAGTVLLKDRILSSSEESHSSGISFSLDKGLSIGEENRKMNQQGLADCRTAVGGNLVVSAQDFHVENAMSMDVGNMIIDARNVNFEGAELHNTSSMDKCSVDIWINQVGISGGQSRSREKKVASQNITVRGTTHFTNAENVNLTACNLDTGAMSGNIDNLNVISKQSEIEASTDSKSIGFTMVEGFPVPNKFGRSQSSDVGKFVEKSSGIHCRGPINQDEFQVRFLKLKGSSVTADGNVFKTRINNESQVNRNPITPGY